MQYRLLADLSGSRGCRRRAGPPARGPVRLLHIVDELLAEQTFESEERTVYDPLRARMSEQVDSLQAQHPDVGISGAVHPGFLEEALTDWADQAGDLLVVAARGQRADTARLLLGSVAERSAQRAQGLVLVIRSAEPFLAWSASRPLRVVLGVDFSTPSRAAVRFVRSLRALGPCDVRLVHVLQPDELVRRFGIPPENGGARDPETAALVEMELQRALGPLDGPGLSAWSIEPPTRRIEVALAEHAASAGLLVLGTNQRRGLSRAWYGSVSRGGLARAGANVALVPATAHDKEADVTRFREVLVPLDLSPASLRAVPYALARLSEGGTVHLLHVVTEVPPPPGIEAARLAELRQEQEGLVRGRGLTLMPHVVADADPCAAILQATARLGIDALCRVPRRQRSTLAELVLGSTSREVLARCRCPVLVVPPEEG